MSKAKAVEEAWICGYCGKHHDRKVCCPEQREYLAYKEFKRKL